MNREDEFLQKRIRDLANQSYRTGLYTYTGFLTVTQQQLYHQIKKELGDVTGTLFGGIEECERNVLRFGDKESLGYDPGFPICCVEITPALAKFSDDLNHRDYLGALMNLGIERSTLGDIMIREKTAYLFCLDTVADYIVDNLSQIKHTTVRANVLQEMPQAVQPQKEEVKLVVPSMRYDVVIAKMVHLSRSSCVSLFREKKIFVNGRQMENNSGVMKEGDVVSVRGYGKFVCDSILGETRKGNLSVQLSRYV
jgi:RNA-binding protein YlmH